MLSAQVTSASGLNLHERREKAVQGFSVLIVDIMDVLTAERTGLLDLR